MLPREEIILLAKTFLSYLPPLKENHYIDSSAIPEDLKEHLDHIAIHIPPNLKENEFTLRDAPVMYHPYSFNSEPPESVGIGSESLDTDVATQWFLPNAEFDGIWESLIFEDDTKSKLLRYASSSLLFYEQGVQTNILPWNKVIFLHGPPGTGKTSLCKALAQKICIRFEANYVCAYFVEIHSHNLFSKWFSESGKLVYKLFEVIESMVEDKQVLVMLLIDEVETLAHSRLTSLKGSNEPSDGIRVVNALLTHLDKIKRYPNVLIMTTSNITQAVDMALVDRADIKQYIGLPCEDAIFGIYSSCLKELKRAGIISPNQEFESTEQNNKNSSGKNRALMAISRQSVGLSGRTIRKLPLMAHALYFEGINISEDRFLEALSLAVDQQFEDRKNFAEL